MLSYIENDVYFLSMEMCDGGDYVIILRKKIDENHGQRIYTHICRESNKNEDFAFYYNLEERIKKITF